MAKAKYEAASNEVIELTRKIINTFPEKFIKVNIDDLHFIFKDVEKSKMLAHVRLLSGSLQTLTKKKIEFCVWKQHWESSDLNNKAMTIYHELTHIFYDSDKNKYKLLRHDVEDFHELLELFGLNRDKLDAAFVKLK